MNREQKDFLCACIQSGEFRRGQIYQIMRAAEYGLPIERIEMIANKEFHGDQMEQICNALFDLTRKQVKVIANPKLSSLQMKKLCEAYRDYGLSIEQVEYLVQHNTPWREIEKYRVAFNYGLNMEEIEALINDGLDWKQVIDLYYMIVNGLKLENIKRLQKTIEEINNESRTKRFRMEANGTTPFGF